jgi:hypothetical protein
MTMNVAIALGELALSRPVDEGQVTQAYRRMAKRFHPDKATATDEKLWAQKKFVRIQEAYEFLKGLSVEEINGSETVERADREIEPPNVVHDQWPDQGIADPCGDEIAEVAGHLQRLVDWPMLFVCLFVTLVAAWGIYHFACVYMGKEKHDAIGTAILGSPLPFFLSAYLYISHMCKKEDRRRHQSKPMR